MVWYGGRVFRGVSVDALRTELNWTEQNGTDMDSREKREEDILYPVQASSFVLVVITSWEKEEEEDGGAGGGGKRKHWVLPRTTQTMMMTTTTTTMSFHICRFGRDDGFSFSPQFAAVSFPVCVLVCLRLCVCVCVEVLTVCMSVCEGVWGGGIKKFTCLRCCLPQTAANFYALPTFFFPFFLYPPPDRTEPTTILPTTYHPLFWLLLYFISSSLSGFVFFLSFWRV